MVDVGCLTAESSHGEAPLSVVEKSATNRQGDAFPTVAKFATVQNEGGRQIVRQVEHSICRAIWMAVGREVGNYGIIRVLPGIELRGDGGTNGSHEGRWVETDRVLLRMNRKA